MSLNGPAYYANDPRAAVLPVDNLIATVDGVGRVGRLPGPLPGAPYRRPAGVYVGTEGVESQGPVSGGGALMGGNTTVVTAAMSPYTILPTDGTLLISQNAPVVLNLLSGITYRGRRLVVHFLDFTGSTVTFVPVAGENVNGQATMVMNNPGASYGAMVLDAVGDDGVGFVKGWSVIVNTSGTYLELSSGPTFAPIFNGILKLGSPLRSFQPYTRGLYFSDNQRFVFADSPVQLQSYMAASVFDTVGGAIVANLNLSQGLGQLRLLKVYGNPLNTLTINPAGADTIDGVAAPLVLTPALAGSQSRIMVGFVGGWETVGAF